jgi:hypothetical protein
MVIIININIIIIIIIIIKNIKYWNILFNDSFSVAFQVSFKKTIYEPVELHRDAVDKKFIGFYIHKYRYKIYKEK